MSDSSETTVEKGVREADVSSLVESILQYDSMNLPIVPDIVKRTIYRSTIKLSFNLFYSSLSRLDGTDFLQSSPGGTSKLLHLERSFVEKGHRHKNWAAFQQTIDVKPLDQLASLLLKNEAVNQAAIPDAVEKDMYVNCLKIIFWVLHIITCSMRINFCGHTISMNLAPASSYFQSRTRGSQMTDTFIKQISAFIVNPQTIETFSREAQALLQMDGSGNKGGGGIKSGMAFLRSSLSKVQEVMIKRMNTSLYGMILAIVDDLLSCTKIEVLNDEISFRVGNSQPQSNWKNSSGSTFRSSQSGNGPAVPQMNEVSMAVDATMADLDFSQQRAILLHRFQQFSPEERALLLQDLSN